MLVFHVVIVEWNATRMILVMALSLELTLMYPFDSIYNLGTFLEVANKPQNFQTDICNCIPHSIQSVVKGTTTYSPHLLPKANSHVNSLLRQRGNLGPPRGMPFSAAIPVYFSGPPIPTRPHKSLSTYNRSKLGASPRAH